MAVKPGNAGLGRAKAAKNDEFYTQYDDIQKEIEAYLEYDPDVFQGKVVYCNCDDPYESNFFRYFVLKFDTLGLKQLITTSYRPVSKIFAKGSSITNWRARGYLVCLASSLFSQSINATISMPPTAEKERLPLLNQYSRITQ